VFPRPWSQTQQNELLPGRPLLEKSTQVKLRTNQWTDIIHRLVRLPLSFGHVLEREFVAPLLPAEDSRVPTERSCRDLSIDAMILKIRQLSSKLCCLCCW
jgi:hypothetical protein